MKSFHLSLFHVWTLSIKGVWRSNETTDGEKKAEMIHMFDRYQFSIYHRVKSNVYLMNWTCVCEVGWICVVHLCFRAVHIRITISEFFMDLPKFSHFDIKRRGPKNGSTGSCRTELKTSSSSFQNIRKNPRIQEWSPKL